MGIQLDLDTQYRITYHNQASEVMLSSMVALKLQLHSKIMVGNCCSNFHLVLFDLAKNGCGLSESTQCLQETSNPNDHVCCQWIKTEECNKPRGQQLWFLKKHHSWLIFLITSYINNQTKCSQNSIRVDQGSSTK